MKKMIYPSKLHEEYINRVVKACKVRGLSLLIKGSLANGTATKFSDIDVLVVGDIKEDAVDDIICAYGNPVMTNYTENPKGILILLYKDGISVDLELRKTITANELKEYVVLVKSKKSFNIEEEVVRYTVTTKYLPNRELWYKTLRLGHRALIKYLSKKEKEAMVLLNEMKEQFFDLGIKGLPYNSEFKHDILMLVDKIFQKYNVDEPYKQILIKLLGFL